MNFDEETGLVILASGISKRFGSRDKLLSPFRGRVLASHSASLAKDKNLSACVCVLRPDSPELEKIFGEHKIELVFNNSPEAGQGNSLAMGINAIAKKGCQQAFVVLADMPLVTSAHLDMLRLQIGSHEASIAFDGKRRSPPALFRRSLFHKLAALTGDVGAREVLRSSITVKEVIMPPSILVDIDTPEDLKRAEPSSTNTT